MLIFIGLFDDCKKNSLDLAENRQNLLTILYNLIIFIIDIEEINN